MCQRPDKLPIFNLSKIYLMSPIDPNRILDK